MWVVSNLIFTSMALFSLGFLLLHIKKTWFNLATVGKGLEENRLEKPLIRFRNMFLWGGLQGRMFKDLVPAIMHFIIFSGFMVVSLGTLETFIQGVYRSFSMETILGTGQVFSIYIISQDIANFLVALAVGFAVTRRLFFPPKRFENLPKASRADALVILSLIFGLVFTSLITLGSLNLSGLSSHLSSSVLPFSTLVVKTLSAPFTMTTKTWEILFNSFWWIHCFTLFSFMIYLPFSKHQHFIWVWPNMFFKHFKSTGRIRPMEFPEDAESFGVGKVGDFTWKQLLDGMTCVECGRCTSVCPAASTGKKLDPRMIILGTKEAFKQEIKEPKEKKKELIREIITEEELWDCTTCGACMEACPLHIEHIPSIVDMRRYLTMTEGAMPEELQTTLMNLENQNNPWGFSSEKREEWFKDLDVKTMREKSDVEYLLWVGCSGALDQRYQKVSQSLVKILNKAGISYSVLGKEEQCNGDTARRAGNEYLAQMQIEQNIETFKRYKVKKVITPCPHCFNTFKNEYDDFGVKLEVTHHTEIIQDLIAQKKISLDENTEKVRKVTYHDSCYLGRHNKIYDAPRKILDNIKDVTPKEMPRNKKNGFCCGAGGARMWMEETKGVSINEDRAKEAIKTGAETVATACPFCLTMLTDGVKSQAPSKDIAVKDLAEIVAEKV